MGLGVKLPAILSILGLGRSLVEAEKIRRGRQEWFDEPIGVAAPTTEFSWLPRTIEGAPEELRQDVRHEMQRLIGEYPHGLLRGAGIEAGEETRVAQREALGAGRGEISQPHEELIGRMEERLESPAISQREVNTMISQMRGEMLGAGEQRAAAFERSQPARSLAPGSADALRQMLSAETGRAMVTGEMATELEAARLNRMFESDYMRQLAGATGAYTAQVAPFYAEEARLAGPGTGLTQMADYMLAMDLMERGYEDEARMLIASLSMAGAQGAAQWGMQSALINQQQEAMEAAQPSALGQALGAVGQFVPMLSMFTGGGTPAPSYASYPNPAVTGQAMMLPGM